jgi:hypothetical protein
MGPIDTFSHLLSFLAPAAAIACMVALAGRVMLPGQSRTLSWPTQAAINLVVGAVVLVAGLWYWGVDGKMGTYTLLAVAIGTCQWACGGCWRR